jgi:hypothetical protein
MVAITSVGRIFSEQSNRSPFAILNSGETGIIISNVAMRGG